MLGVGWNYFGAVGLVVAAGLFRKQVIQNVLKLLMRALSAQRFKTANAAIHEFEKRVLHPLSWVLFVVSILVAMKIASIDVDTLTTVVFMVLGVAVLWTVFQFCAFVNVVIVRSQGWERSTSKDDSSKAMIVSEGIGLLKYILGAAILHYFFFNQLNFNTTEVFTTMVLVGEVLFVLSSHTWFRNVMGGLVLLIDEPIKSGNHVHVLGHSGVVEHMYLQYFTLRQYDKGLAFIPNSVVFHHTIDVHAKSQDTCFNLTIPLSRATPAAATRAFVRDADSYLSSYATAMAAKPTPSSAATPSDKRETSAVDAAAPAGTAPKSQFHLAVKAFARTSLFAKATAAAASDAHLDAPTKFWVALVDLHTVHLVYFFPPTLKFRHVVQEKRKLVLGVTKLLEANELALHSDNDLLTEPVDAVASQPIESAMPHDAPLAPSSSALPTPSPLASAPPPTNKTPSPPVQDVKEQGEPFVASRQMRPTQRPPSSSIEFSSSSAATAASMLRRRSAKAQPGGKPSDEPVTRPALARTTPPTSSKQS